MRKLFVFFTSFLVLLLGGAPVFASDLIKPLPPYMDYSSDYHIINGYALEQIETAIADYYYKNVDLWELEKCLDKDIAVRIGMCLGDAHTRYVAPQDAKNDLEDISGKFAGVGIIIARLENKITVLNVIRGGPAHLAGLKARDLVTHILIDGKKVSLEGMHIREVIRLIRGEEGTKAILIVERNHEVLPPIEIIRYVLKYDSVKSAMFGSKIGYIKIEQFTLSTLNELQEEFIDLSKQGMRGLIVDVRYNPGGLLPQALDTTREFSPYHFDTLIVADYQKISLKYKVMGLRIYSGPPIAVLVNKNSASAAEFFSGVMQKWGYLIVGGKTYGKGTIQWSAKLENGGILWLTAGEYFISVQGNRQKINGIGVKPDIEVLGPELPKDPWKRYEMIYLIPDPQKDSQLKAAIEELKKKIVKK